MKNTKKMFDEPLSNTGLYSLNQLTKESGMIISGKKLVDMLMSSTPTSRGCIE